MRSFTRAPGGTSSARSRSVSTTRQAAAGISGFGRILKNVEDNAPLKRNVTIEEVGNAAAFLSSDLASGITGEILYVDAGYNIVGMSFGE